MAISRPSSAIFRPVSPPSSASAQPTLLPLDASGPLDNAERQSLWRWRHMHRRKRGPLLAAEIKRLSWDQAGTGPQRFVWEAAQWRQGDALVWVVLCWSIDEPIGVWWKDFPSQGGARRYFAKSPASVMKPVVKPATEPS